MTNAHIPAYARGYELFPGHIGRTAEESQRAWPREQRAPHGAPNIVVMLLDDMGYSDIGPFGSEIDTPHLDGLAAQGFRLTNYHTTPVCSPARAALLTGLNAHRAGFASVANSDPGFPNLRLELDEDVLTLPEILRSHGYATFGIGKWHLTRDALMHDGADKRTWPLQRGFDRYYGTLEGCNSFFHPNRLLRDNTPLDLPETPPDYYLTDDLTNEALAMIKALRANDARKPFFLYFAHHAMHGPLGAKAADLAKYRGRYAAGWDEARRRRHARQLAQGLFPAGTPLPDQERHPAFAVPAWQALTATEQARYARYMEVYAAMVDNVDQNLGRLLDTLEQLGERENTLVVFTSDNGGTREGGLEGTRSYFSRFVVDVAGLPTDWEPDVERDLDLIGGPRTMVHYPRGWGRVSNTPFRFYKGQTFAGGVRVPFVLAWPQGLRKEGADTGLRHQYQYVTDVLPTILELAGLPHPGRRHNLPTKEIDGASFAPVLRANTASTHSEQYAEFGGSRGYYRDGWKLLTNHTPGTPYDDAEWELYHVASDPNELHNRADDEPGRTKEMAQAWEQAAWANTVFPLLGRAVSSIRRPAEAELERPVTLWPGTSKLERYRSSKLIALRSFAVEVDLQHDPEAAGVLVAHGDQGGGYALFVEDGQLHLAYNEYGRLHDIAAGALAGGHHLVRLDAAWRPGFRWDLRVQIDGRLTGALDAVWMLVGMAPFSGIDVGCNRGGPVHWGLYERHGSFPYTGGLRHVRIIPGEPALYGPAQVAKAAQEAALFYD
jgi:arylsulfatase A-like enzyme